MHKMTPGQAKAAEAMSEMRAKLLTTPPSELGFSADKDFPALYGALLEFRIDDITATVYGLRDGSASVYTTGGFGVIGGIGHESVRQAAGIFVSMATRFVNRGIQTTTFPYPADGKTQFYFLTYDGPRLCTIEESAIMTGKDELRDLYAAGQDLLTKLRTTQESVKP